MKSLQIHKNLWNTIKDIRGQEASLESSKGFIGAAGRTLPGGRTYIHYTAPWQNCDSVPGIIFKRFRVGWRMRLPQRAQYRFLLNVSKQNCLETISTASGYKTFWSMICLFGDDAPLPLLGSSCSPAHYHSSANFLLLKWSRSQRRDAYRMCARPAFTSFEPIGPLETWVINH